MDETTTNDGLKYIGDGSTAIGVPPRDLTADEVKQYGGRKFLIETKLYASIKVRVSKPSKTSTQKGDAAEHTQE